MLTLSIIKKPTNLLGKNVHAMAKLLLGCESTGIFCCNFNHELKKMSTGTQGKADSYYYAIIEKEWTNEECVHVKHRKAAGKDEIVMIVENIKR
jgi:hypothetical protein